MLVALLKYFNFQINGIIHVGANDCEEHNTYLQVTNQILWIEANPAFVQKAKIKYKNIKIFEALISDSVGNEVKFYISNNNGQSSSMLEFAEHSSMFPDIKYVEELNVTTTTLDHVLLTNKINIGFFNCLVLDIQGVELKALLGASKTLQFIDFIYTEVNIGETYRNCDRIEDMDLYLHSLGYVRLCTRIFENCTYGDALYVKTDAANNRIVRAKKFLITLKSIFKKDKWF
jgi:FkbM family methyltransferase